MFPPDCLGRSYYDAMFLSLSLSLTEAELNKYQCSPRLDVPL